MSRLVTSFFLIIASLLVSIDAQAVICRVSSSGLSGNDGATWAAPKNLSSALSTTSCTEIWLAPGTYTGGFSIARNLVLRGGFAGTETLASERVTPIDPGLTLLDGGSTQRVLAIDGTTAGGSITASTLIEGLTIQNGSNMTGLGWGGGVYCNASLYNVNRTCSPVFQSVRFVDNSAKYGGALYLDAAYNGYGTANPQLIDVLFDGNSATQQGGAIYIWANLNGHASPVITGTTFVRNSAPSGGAIYNNSGSQGSTQTNAVITNTTFAGNTANSTDATVKGGGAIYNAGTNGTNAMQLTNVTFSGNQALGTNKFGGAIYNSGSNAKPIITNTIFWSNEASNSTTNDFYVATGVQITSSIVQSGCPSGAICTNVLTTNPQLSALADNGGFGQTLLPSIPGSAIDSGAGGATCPAIDQRGITRPQGSGCDIGAVEIEQIPQYTLTVTVTGAGSVSGGAISACTANSGTCNASYTTPDSVSLSATEDMGYHFSGWSGDCSGGGVCNLTMDANHSVTALFEINSYVVTASAGSGGTLSCADASVTHGSSTICTAVPDTGYGTQSISGCNGAATGTGVDSYTTGAVTAACTVIATFQINSYAISSGVNIAGAGTLQCPATVVHGDSATCTASSPGTGYQLIGFTGCDIVSGSDCTLNNVTSTRSVIANYAPITSFSGTTVPSSGQSGAASASFTGGGATCRFDDSGATAFVAASASPPPGKRLPQGLFQFQLIGCDTTPVIMSVTWPQAVTDYIKYGRENSMATEDSYFTPTGLQMNGNMVTYIVQDGALGDDDWSENGTIVDPSGPMVDVAAAVPPTPVPMLTYWGLGMLLLGLCALGGVPRWLYRQG